MIRAAIIGYGNLGRSVERVIADQPDMELVGVFSRRDSLDTDAKVLPAADVDKHADDVDVLFVCLGSATDVPEQAPALAKLYTTVDTYDNHRDIPRHRADMDAAAREAGLSLPVGGLIAQLVASTVATGDGALDHSGLFRTLATLSGANPDQAPDAAS